MGFSSEEMAIRAQAQELLWRRDMEYNTNSEHSFINLFIYLNVISA